MIVAIMCAVNTGSDPEVMYVIRNKCQANMIKCITEKDIAFTSMNVLSVKKCMEEGKLTSITK